MHLTEGIVHDVNALDVMPVEPGAYYIMDKGYVDFYRLFNHIHKRRAFFVTRAKNNMTYQILDTFSVERSTGVISDNSVILTGYKSSMLYPDNLRMVEYEDFATNNVYIFLTNDFDLQALTIAELYRDRWKIELFFKWIKQHLHIKAFYGTSRNAVYCQIWIAICTYLLIAIAKKKLDLSVSLYTLSQTLGLTLFEKTYIKELFNNEYYLKNPSDENQLSIWNF